MGDGARQKMQLGSSKGPQLQVPIGSTRRTWFIFLGKHGAIEWTSESGNTAPPWINALVSQHNVSPLRRAPLRAELARIKRVIIAAQKDPEIGKVFDIAWRAGGAHAVTALIGLFSDPQPKPGRSTAMPDEQVTRALIAVLFDQPLVLMWDHDHADQGPGALLTESGLDLRAPFSLSAAGAELRLLDQVQVSGVFVCTLHLVNEGPGDAPATVEYSVEAKIERRATKDDWMRYLAGDWPWDREETKPATPRAKGRSDFPRADQQHEARRATPEVLFDLLSLVVDPLPSPDADDRTLRGVTLNLGDPRISLEVIGTWSQADREKARDWATAEHLHASDNPDVVRLPMPDCVKMAIEATRRAVER